MLTCSVCGVRHRSWLGLDGCRARHRYRPAARAPKPASAPVAAPAVRPREPVAAEAAPARVLTAR